jgi:ribosomal protein L22
VTPPDRTTPEGGWDSLKVDELKDELEARGLSKSGTKAELVARLEEADAGPGDAAAAAETPEAAAPAVEPAAEEPEAPDEGVAEEVVPPEEPAEEPSAEEVETAEAPEAEADEAAEGHPVETEADEVEPVEAEADEDEADEGDEDAEGETAAAPATRRRGAPETSTGTRRAAPRRPDGDVVVRARSKYVRSAPRKARLMMDHIRGKEVEQARAILIHAPRAVAEDILKLLNSAVANAESNYELGPDELRVRKAFVDEGPTIKRFRPRALGRATRISKRTSHMTIELTTTGNGR